jgi:hypothetical protein
MNHQFDSEYELLRLEFAGFACEDAVRLFINVGNVFGSRQAAKKDQMTNQLIIIT